MAFTSAEEWLAERGLHPAKSGPAATPNAPVAGPVADALRFIRRSTARTPQSTQRLRQKLNDRGFDAPCIDEAIAAAQDAGDVNDDAFAAALVDGWLERGHAPARISHDLKKRGFTAVQVAAVLATKSNKHDPYAAAFAVAQARAHMLLTVPPDTALRRLTGHVQRRGYSLGVASKAARDALYAAREQIQSSEA
jgi:SOS response regulatory protein OraA/RecX